MLRCGHCEVICENYESWLAHLVSDTHQAKLGVSDVFTSHKDRDRNERSLLMWKMNPRADPYQVVAHFAQMEPLGFITDVYIHFFSNVSDKFYLIVFDQRKFVERICTIHERCGDQNVLSSIVSCECKASLTEKQWTTKVESSFFYRRHEHLKKAMSEMGWEPQFKIFLSLVSLDATGYQEREKVMDELEILIREVYPEATVNPFGSCTTWLADVNADLDVFVDAQGKGGRLDLGDNEKMEMLKKVAKLLQSKYEARNVFAIKNTRVPIIQLKHPSGLKVDVSFENCLSVQNSKMIRLMTKLDYRIRPFLMFLRYWARYHNLTGSQYVKNYALILMAFVFLRKRKIIPSVHELQNVEGTRSFMVCGWNAAYCNSRDVVQKHLRWLKCLREPPSDERNTQEIMKLAHGFFEEYAGFNFDTQVICPLIGDYLPKIAFDSMNGVDLPPEMGLLKANLVTGQCGGFATQKPLCIQDPFTLNINVTSSCINMDIIYKFKAACSMAAEALKPFAAVYDTAGTENILELCCQTVTDVKKQEMMQLQLTANNPPELDHDNIAYVKTEATTTTKEEENWDWQKDNIPSTSAAADVKVEAESEAGSALQSIKDFYSDNYSCKIFPSPKKKDRNQRVDSDGSRSSRTSMGQTQSGYRSSVGANSSRIHRISIHDGGGDKSTTSTSGSEGSASYGIYPGYTVPATLGACESMDLEVTENSFLKSKAVNSQVALPSRDEGKKAESKKGTRPASLSSSQVSSSTSKEKSSRKEPQPNPARVSERRRSKEKDSIPSPSNHQSLKDIVIRVENRMMKVEKPDDNTKEPVVRFVATSLSPSKYFQSLLVQSSPATQPSTSSSTPLQLQSKVATSESSQVIKKEPVDESESDLDKEVNDFISTLNVQQVAPPEISVRFDQDNNYGYALPVKTPFITSSPSPKPLTPKVKPAKTPIVPYVPPNKRIGTDSNFGNNSPNRPMAVSPSPSSRSSTHSTPRSGLCFPVFTVLMSDDYCQAYYQAVSTLPIQNESFLTSRMKILWVNVLLSDFFTVQQLWKKIEPILYNGLEEIKVVNLDPVFSAVEQYKTDMPAKNSANRKRTIALSSLSEMDSSDAENINSGEGEQGPSVKLRRTSSSSGLPGQPASPTLNDVFAYEHRAALMGKFQKIPSSVRKQYANIYYFQCHPVMMSMLKGYLSKSWSQLQIISGVSPGSPPLDILERLCKIIDASFQQRQQELAPEEWLMVKMLVACDTGGDPPGLYVGFEFENMDDSTYDKLAEIVLTLENLLQYLIPEHMLYRLGKYFK